MKHVKEQYGHYQIRRRIGGGAMGEVFLANDPRMNRLVALKVLGAERSQDKAFVDRFVREARAAGSLAHQNVVGVFDWGTESGEFYIAMEFVDGSDLDRILYTRDEDGNRQPRFRPLPIQISLAMARDACLGLENLHEHEVIHRDLKPANVMLSRSGVLKIADFGLARRVEDSILVTVGPQALGTPAYMSPEAAAGQMDLDTRTDVFSMGTLLYELITSQRPFSGTNIPAVVYAIQSREPAEMRTLNPLVPDAVVDVVQRMLTKDRAKRTVTARDVRVTLEKALVDLGVLNTVDLLREFVEKPKDVVQRLYTASRNENLNQGVFFERQGTGRIQDAIDSYSRVLYVDPAHDDARTRFERLVHESSGGGRPLTLRVPPVPAAEAGNGQMSDPARQGAGEARMGQTISGTVHRALGPDDSVGDGPLLPLTIPEDVGSNVGARRRGGPPGASAPRRWLLLAAVVALSIVLGAGGIGAWKASHRPVPVDVAGRTTPTEHPADTGRLPSPTPTPAPEPPRPAGTVTFRGEPAVANARVDGGPSYPTTEAISGLAAGAHRIVVSAQGYGSSIQHVVLRPGEDRVIDYLLSPGRALAGVSASTDSGEVDLTLDSPGAVTIDGRPVADGVTNAAFRVPAGHHSIVVEHHDFDPKTWTNLLVSKDETVPLAWNFSQHAGKVQIVVNDFVGTVVIDGRDTHLFTPAIIALRSGNHLVKLNTRQGFTTDEGEVQIHVEQGQTVPVSFTIRKAK